MKLLKIGRDTSCDIILHSNKVSAIHAEIMLLNNGDILLEDKNSRNGTYIMNQQIKPATSISIRRGDAIRFADVELQWSQIPTPEDNSNFKAIYGIGTNFRNEIQITGNTVSRFHATLKIGKDGKAYIQDHSKNGTTINDNRIPSNQNVRVKQKDSIVCGGVPIDIKKFIPASIDFKPLPIISTLAAAAIVVLCILFGDRLVDIGTKPKNFIPATTLVNGSYYYTVKIKDDPFISFFNKYGISWPTQFEIGQSAGGNFGFLDNKNYRSLGYSGTAFFVSKDGKMLTNRHVALPWTYIEKNIEDEIKQLTMEFKLKTLENTLIPVLQQVINELGYETCQAYIERYKSSDIEISGRHNYIAVGYAGYNYNTYDEFARCTVIADSEDENIDLAVLQLNTKKTPDDIRIINIDDAITDSKKLNPLEEDYFYIGYPTGTAINYDPQDGGLQPLLNEVKFAKKPGKYNIDLQSEVVGGASGSPVLDKKGRLVGVICSRSTLIKTLSYAVIAKHAYELVKRTE